MEPSFDTLLLDLNSDHWNARRAAARGLGELGDHQAVEPLLERLRVEDWRSVRSALVDALRPMCDARDVPRLVEALPALAEDAQEGVIALLGDRRDARAAPALIQLVLNAVRRAWKAELRAELQALENRMDVEASDLESGALVPALQGQKGMYPAISGGVVWRIDWSAQEEHLECQRRADQVYSQVAAALRQIGPEATPALVVVLRHPIPVMVRLAAEVLTDIGDAGALPNLRAAIRLWQHPPADVKNAIQEAINAIETRLSAFTGHELELVEPAPAAAAPSSGRELTAVGNGRGAVPSAAERTGRELEEAEEPPVREA